MKERIVDLARKNGADIVKFASAEQFSKDDPVFQILPETKTVIALAFRLLRGSATTGAHSSGVIPPDRLQQSAR